MILERVSRISQLVVEFGGIAMSEESVAPSMGADNLPSLS